MPDKYLPETLAVVKGGRVLCRAFGVDVYGR